MKIKKIKCYLLNKRNIFFFTQEITNASQDEWVLNWPVASLPLQNIGNLQRGQLMSMRCYIGIGGAERL